MVGHWKSHRLSRLSTAIPQFTSFGPEAETNSHPSATLALMVLVSSSSHAFPVTTLYSQSVRLVVAALTVNKITAVSSAPTRALLMSILFIASDFLFAISSMPNDKGERPPPTGTAERRRRSGAPPCRGAERRGGSSSPAICWEILSSSHLGYPRLERSRIR
jgi:hypothetical protein